MQEKVVSFLRQLAQFWAALPTPKRLALVGVTTAVLLLVLVIGFLGSRTTYTYLYTDLAPEDAAGIVEKLNAMQVPYEIDAGGTAIRVPKERVHALRLELASAGLPRGGGLGFELFDRSQIGATEFEQQVNLRRALEGELARSITTLEGVRSARVHLVLPERRLFVAGTDSASASVVLKLVNSAGFGRREVAGIVHLVAAAVPGLKQERVSVVSTDGVTLHRPSSGEGTADFGELRTDAAREVARDLEAHAREQLERVVGIGNADVRVNVALSAASKELTEEHYEPSKTALRSEHKVEEAAGAEDPGVAGVPGAQANLPDALPDGAEPSEPRAVAGGGAVRRSHTRNWEVDRVMQKTTTPPGGIDRLSVAVLLNGHWDDTGGKHSFVPRTQKEIDSLTELVKNAVGFNAERGDSVDVRAMKFAELAGADAAKPKESFVKQWLPYLLLGAGALLVLSLIVLVWRIGSSAARAVQERTIANQLGGAVKPAPLTGTGIETRALPEGVSPVQIRAQATDLASKDPATAAVVLRKWLNTSTT